MMYEISAKERSTGVLEPEKLSAVVSDIATQGFAVVDGLVSGETRELLLASILEDVGAVRAHAKPTQHEKRTGQGHLQLGLRRYAPYVKEDLVANPLIEHIVSGILSRGAWLGFYNGNVNLPGSVHQPLHFDRPFSWRSRESAEADGQRWPPPATTLSCSVALTEITEDNGATEIYPGTHLETAVTTWPEGERPAQHPDLIEKWGPPARMAIPAGGICFRDPRMWHRGVPNPSDEIRPMIALTYHAEMCRHWRGRLIRNLSEEDASKCEENDALKVLDDGGLGDGRLVFDGSVREVFAARGKHGVNRNVRFVEAPLKVNHFLDAHLLGGARVIENGDVVPVE